MDRIVGGKFKLGRKIGCGSFGEIYLGERPDPLFLPPFLPSARWVACCSVTVPDPPLLLSLPVSATHVDTYEIVAVKIVSARDSSRLLPPLPLP